MEKGWPCGHCERVWGSPTHPWTILWGPLTTMWNCYWRWGLPALKANKGVRLVERKVCFISEAGNLSLGGGGVGRVGRTCVQRPTSRPCWQSVGKSFYRRREGLYVETAQAALTGILNLVIGGLTSVLLMVFSTVSLQFQGRFVPISLMPVLELWQLMSWLQSGHRVVNFSTWCGFQCL